MWFKIQVVTKGLNKMFSYLCIPLPLPSPWRLRILPKSVRIYKDKYISHVNGGGCLSSVEIVLYGHIAHILILFCSCSEFRCGHEPSFMSLLLMDPQGVCNLLPSQTELQEISYPVILHRTDTVSAGWVPRSGTVGVQGSGQWRRRWAQPQGPHWGAADACPRASQSHQPSEHGVGWGSRGDGAVGRSLPPLLVTMPLRCALICVSTEQAGEILQPAAVLQKEGGPAGTQRRAGRLPPAQALVPDRGHAQGSPGGDRKWPLHLPPPGQPL